MARIFSGLYFLIKLSYLSLVNSTRRVKYLDGLRGVLALVVFVHHFLYLFYPEAIFGGTYQEFLTGNAFALNRIVALTPLNILFNPGMAIYFFFILSGYIQTLQYFETKNTLILQTSFLKRYFRLAIPTLVVVLLVYCFHKLHLIQINLIPQNPLSNSWTKSLLPDNLNVWQVILHGAFDCFNGMSHYYQILWTMPVELYNSFMVLILAMFTHRVKQRAWLFFLWLFVQLFFLKSYYSAGFTIGLSLACFEKNSVVFTSVFSRKIVQAGCFVVGIYFASYPYTGYLNASENSVYRPISFFEVYPHILSYTLGDTLLFCSFIFSARAQHVFSIKPLLFFGKISFMFYLIHFLVLLSFSPWLLSVLKSRLSLSTSLLVDAALSLCVINASAYLLYRLVDLPVLRNCNRVVSNLFPVSEI